MSTIQRTALNARTIAYIAAELRLCLKDVRDVTRDNRELMRGRTFSWYRENVRNEQAGS